MVLTRDFRETVQARVRRDTAFRKGLLRDAVERLLAGEVALGKELLRDYINATVGLPKLAEETKLHVKTLQQMGSRLDENPHLSRRGLGGLPGRRGTSSESPFAQGAYSTWIWRVPAGANTIPSATTACVPSTLAERTPAPIRHG